MRIDGRRDESPRTYHAVRLSRHVVAASVVLTAWLSVSDCVAQTSGGTLWDFLGIPTNAAAQASSNPAIAAAAKAKAAKHEICKKKKALQYLAGMGCSAEHPEVAAALLAAMGDPEEPVRYEAVKAVLQTAEACQSNEQKRASRKALSHSERCHDLKKKIDKAVCDCIDRLCGKAPPKEHKHKLKTLLGRDECPQEPADCGKGQGSCCTPEIREKLQQLAYGRDEHGCFLERSSRVRELAAAALQACAACGGCGCQNAGAGMVLREMPPEEARETGAESTDRLLDGDCVYESVVVPLSPHMQPTLADPLPPEPPAPDLPSAHGVPAPEPIPAPSASLERAAGRLAMVPTPGVRLPVAVLPARPAPPTPPRRPSEIWNPASPAETLARVAALPTGPNAIPAADLDAVRQSLGTRGVGLSIPRLPGPRPAASRTPGPVNQSALEDSAGDIPALATAAMPWLLRGVAIVLTIAAAMAAVVWLGDGDSERRRNRHE